MTKTEKVSLFFKLATFVSAVVGVTLNLLPTSYTGPHNILYFTTQSNIWVGVVSLVGAIMIIYENKTNKIVRKRWMHILKLVFTVSITVTGLIYCTMLAPLAKGYNPWTINNILCHVTVPAFAIADFFLRDSKEDYKYREGLYATIPFFYYLLFSSIGFVLNWNFGEGRNYPYFFLDWNSPAGAFGFIKEFPYLGVNWWGIILTAMVFLLACFYIKLTKIKNRKLAK